MLTDFEIIEKLYNRCGPVLRHRIATELMGKKCNETEELRRLVLSHPEVQQYIDYYSYGAKQGMEGAYFYPKMIHGSKSEQLENTVGKLWSLGVRKGFPEVDQFLDAYIEVMEYDYYRENVIRVGYGINDIARLLSFLGYAEEEHVHKIMQRRLDEVYSFVREGRYDIYVNIRDYPKPPSAWKNIKKIIDPLLTRYDTDNGEPPLPFMYDILGFWGMKQSGINKENETKIEAILKYCFNERYQHDITPGYGILLTPTGNYYSMGWSIHLPGYGQQLDQNVDMKQLLLWVDLLSHFDMFKELQFFKDLLVFLENYRDNDGFYTFPKEFIPEEKTGYFVLGKRMGLGENRRQREAYSNEATFRTLKIKKNMGLI